jgi:hypothetical protein
MTAVLRRLTYWRGLHRLRWGCCPACNSSPPRPTCPVCQGSYDYGRHASGLRGPLSAADERLWRSRWERRR